MNETEIKLLEIIRKNCNGGDYPKPDSHLRSLNLDSLSFIAVIVDIETEFGIEFSDDDLDFYAYDSVEDLLKVLQIKEKKNV